MGFSCDYLEKLLQILFFLSSVTFCHICMFTLQSKTKHTKH